MDFGSKHTHCCIKRHKDEGSALSWKKPYLFLAVGKFERKEKHWDYKLHGVVQSSSSNGKNIYNSEETVPCIWLSDLLVDTVKNSREPGGGAGARTGYLMEDIRTWSDLLAKLYIINGEIAGIVDTGPSTV